ncbi:methyltransferase [Dyella solisilvae]|uniref:Methyltransferase n=1 Tax=Dyella solisilvae TaxID=1920168 RepID=A0A370K572_9GAMM|nr:class I SAM-dependent methyltransferase [Dyella solisilvae]RDI97783.1 methyltransferase [Dyella solisilvae]
MKLTRLFALFAVLAAPVSLLAGGAVPAYVAAAIATPDRPAADRDLDTQRKPDQVLAFAGIKPGDVVVDLMPGSGYYTRLLSRIVGPGGKVYALQPQEMDKAAPKGLQSLRGFAGKPPYANVIVLLQPVSAMSLPEPADLIWTSQNYHDLHDPFMGSPDIARLDRWMFDALKPGGHLLVLDHAAAPGSGVSRTDDLHRIDPAAVQRELTAAGFQPDGESDALRNPSDPHTAGIYDPSVRGHTDRFILRFRKP